MAGEKFIWNRPAKGYSTPNAESFLKVSLGYFFLSLSCSIIIINTQPQFRDSSVSPVSQTEKRYCGEFRSSCSPVVNLDRPCSRWPIQPEAYLLLIHWGNGKSHSWNNTRHKNAEFFPMPTDSLQIPYFLCGKRHTNNSISKLFCGDITSQPSWAN